MSGEYDPAQGTRDADGSFDNQRGAVGVDEAPMGEFDSQPMVASREQCTRATVDANHRGEDRMAYEPASERLSDGVVLDRVPESMVDADTVVQEKAAARELEIERTRVRCPDDDRTARTWAAVTAMDINGFDQEPEGTAERRPSVPLGGLPAETQAEAAADAARIHEEAHEAYTALDIQWKLGDRLRDGASLWDAVTRTMEEVRLPPTVTPIGHLGDPEKPYRQTVKGEVTTLWESSHEAIHQVGLLEDDTGQVKFTIWKSALGGAGLTSTYAEPGYTREDRGAMLGRVEEGDTVELWEAKRAYDHKGRPCLEVDNTADVTTLARKSGPTEYTPQRRLESPMKLLRKHR